MSVIGDETVKQEALKSLQSAAGFIGVQASKQVVMRYFPELRFIIDNSLDKQMRVEELIDQIEKERNSRD
ncbi:MAG: Ribosome-binding factor A [Chlamydiales bacterium]|nr:Ribosome-binding factor A [Chlamydiales bacterium]